MKKTQTLSILNFLALLVHVTLSYLTQFKLINEQDVGQVSDAYDSLFTPAGITFAIWGVIYTALLFFCIYHIRMAFKNEDTHPANENVRRIGFWFILNNIGAAAWLIVWTKGWIPASAGLILFQLLTLIVIQLRLNIHDPSSKPDSKIFTQFPLSIYFGWLTIATIANISVYLLASGWKGFGLDYSPIEWTRIMIGIAVFLTALVVFTRRNVFFGLVIIWALYGIILKRESLNSAVYADVIKTARIGLGIVAACCIIQFLQNITAKKKLPSFPQAASSAK
jgi:TspO/MBR family